MICLIKVGAAGFGLLRFLSAAFWVDVDKRKFPVVTDRPDQQAHHKSWE